MTLKVGQEVFVVGSVKKNGEIYSVQKSTVEKVTKTFAQIATGEKFRLKDCSRIEKHHIKGRNFHIHTGNPTIEALYKLHLAVIHVHEGDNHVPLIHWEEPIFKSAHGLSPVEIERKVRNLKRAVSTLRTAIYGKQK